eukprot:Nitzschia sp. Nitz4//scaffold11_size288233//240348//242487//NITZ4_000811-RA/size288233-processed-gene-0.248-mRNA-1//-1//CDS//3329534185//10//frame0
MSEDTLPPGNPSVKTEEEEDDDDEDDLFKADDDEEPTPAPTISNNADTPVQTEIPSEPQAPSSSTVATNSSEKTSIPRVAPSEPPAPAASGGGQAAQYGLPEGVVVPPSITPALLSGRLLETLRGLSKQLINDALAEYDDAVQIKGDTIRNHGAYLFGVIKRYVSVQERAASGEGEGILPMGPELTPAVNERLQKLVTDGFCSQEEMNDKVKSKIRMLSERDALFALEELSTVNRTQVRNFGSYFMGILNRYMRGERKDVTSGKKTVFSTMQLAEVRQAMHQQQPPPQQHADRYPPRGRDTEPQYRRQREDPNSAYRRERSRDRYGGDPSFGRSGQSDFHDPYGPPRNAYGNNPPPPPRPMQDGPNSYQPHPGVYNQGMPPSPYGQQPPPMNHHQPPPQQYSQQVSRQPPSPYGASPQMQGQPRMPGAHEPPQHQQYGHQSLVHQYGNMQQGGNQANSYGNPVQSVPQYGNQQPPSQSYSNAPYNHNPNTNRYPPPTGQGQWAMQNPPPNSHGPPVDIMALADKASSALQAVQNQNGYHNPGPAPNQGPSYGGPPSSYIPPPGNQSYPPPYQQNQPRPPNPAMNGQRPRRRTTAAMADLPLNVQYAVQNLQATGKINGPLDDGMLGMVKDLPEDLALQALQKFSSIDQRTMRNPTAYLAGVLRSELELIHRR